MKSWNRAQNEDAMVNLATAALDPIIHIVMSRAYGLAGTKNQDFEPGLHGWILQEPARSCQV